MKTLLESRNDVRVDSTLRPESRTRVIKFWSENRYRWRGGSSGIQELDLSSSQTWPLYLGPNIHKVSSVVSSIVLLSWMRTILVTLTKVALSFCTRSSNGIVVSWYRPGYGSATLKKKGPRNVPGGTSSSLSRIWELRLLQLDSTRVDALMCWSNLEK